MCGRFAQFNPLDILKARFEIETITATAAPSYNIAPTREVLVLIDHQGLRLGKLKWGFTSRYAVKGKKPGLLINARTETLRAKKTFRESFTHRRCLILADGFYEWKQEGTTRVPNSRVPYYFYLPDRQPFGFAGLWETLRTEDGSTLSTCVIITRNAEGPAKTVHDRMPAIVSMDHIRRWLSPGDPALYEQILSDHSITDLQCHRVSSKVNSGGFDSPLCIENIGQEDSNSR